ncbi:response regulator [Agaribacter flavus]|uniref:Response regulator transcription factor n=1 Tax=Agaribacter flavus TaxID=1902781 RepID=A0ABV7FJK6_9ALTE
MKIIILDDHALFREGLQYILQAIDRNIEVLQAPSLKDAQYLLSSHAEIELLLIDLDMPVNDGFEALDLFTTLYPTLPCVILSASTKRTDVEKALEHGALGYISKASKGEILRNALKLILSGEIYIPYDIMLSERRQDKNLRVKLTERQLEVMALRPFRSFLSR